MVVTPEGIWISRSLGLLFPTCSKVFRSGLPKSISSNDVLSQIEYVEISDSEGLLYPLKNEILYRCHSRGISNEITEAFATFEIKNGKALIIESEDRR